MEPQVSRFQVQAAFALHRQRAGFPVQPGTARAIGNASSTPSSMALEATDVEMRAGIVQQFTNQGLVSAHASCT